MVFLNIKKASNTQKLESINNRYSFFLFPFSVSIVFYSLVTDQECAQAICCHFALFGTTLATLRLVFPVPIAFKHRTKLPNFNRPHIHTPRLGPGADGHKLISGVLTHRLLMQNLNRLKGYWSLNCKP